MTPQGRDLRIDFCRGLALIFIFVDHVPGNRLADFTLRNFGFSDAAEIFIFLAGYSAVLAYGRDLEADGFAGYQRLGRRIGTIYAWHLGLLIGCTVLLGLAAQLFAKPAYIQQIGLEAFFETPGRALLDAMMLFNQPNLLNILPVYVVLLAWFPVAYTMIRKSPLQALAISFAIWAGTNLIGFNLPSAQGPNKGWFFNPFAWQLLLTAGAVAAVMARDARPSPFLTKLAAGYVIFAFVAVAPWTRLPGLEGAQLIDLSALGPMNKTYLSLWRLSHLLALAYLMWTLIPRDAAWLKHPVSEAIGRCGRHALEVFSLGVMLSMVGWIAMNESQSPASTHVLVNVGGIAAMGATAWVLAQRRLGYDFSRLASRLTSRAPPVG